MQVHADYSRINMTHHIHKLRFGPSYPGRINALDGFDRIVDHDYGTFKYFLTIVPTRYVSASWWSSIETFSYSVSEYFVPGSAHHSGGGVNVEAMPSLQFRCLFTCLYCLMYIWTAQLHTWVSFSTHTHTHYQLLACLKHCAFETPQRQCQRPACVLMNI